MTPQPVQPEQSDGAPRRRLARCCLALALALAGLLWSPLGCGSAEERYRVLSFFFDGVPVPPSLLKDMPELADRGRDPFDDSQTTKTDEEKPKPVFYHEPYINRSCFGCHDSKQGFKVAKEGAASCQSCHESHFDLRAGDWGHGPAIIGQCRLCHQPHKSENPGLLTATQPDLCMTCHTPELLEQPFHASAKAGVDKCSRCHDPHLSGNRKLLADSRTYVNRKFGEFKPQSVHKPFLDRQCAECHVVEQNNRVRDDIDAVCGKCHESVVAQAQAPDSGVHEAVAKGKCISCHAPHQSPLKHLVRPSAEKMCVDCHEPQKLAEKNHPAAVVRADCLICHMGHQSKQPKLLRPWDVQPPSQPTEPRQPQQPDDLKSEPLNRIAARFPDEGDLAQEPP
jgi:predicted CXXCH cytochrome family protein